MDEQDVQEYLAELDGEILMADGLSQAFMGTAYRCGLGPVAAYDRTKCIQILIDRDGMTWEEAEEFFSFNIEGAYVGKLTPVFITLPEGPPAP